MIADIITVTRMLFSLFLLVVPPSSRLFAALYLLCGVSDVLDGFAARKLHTESEKGARLDSAADLLFSLMYVVRILPLLSVPLWILIWTAGIALVKASGIILASINARVFIVQHSFANKLTGILVFLLPLSVSVADVKYGAALACAAATVSTVEEIYKGYGCRK